VLGSSAIATIKKARQSSVRRMPQAVNVPKAVNVPTLGNGQQVSTEEWRRKMGEMKKEAREIRTTQIKMEWDVLRAAKREKGAQERKN